MAEDYHAPSHPFEQAAGDGVGAVELWDGASPFLSLTAFSHLLAKGMQRKEQTVRQQLRECYDDTPRKRGAKR